MLAATAASCLLRTRERRNKAKLRARSWEVMPGPEPVWTAEAGAASPCLPSRGWAAGAERGFVCTAAPRAPSHMGRLTRGRELWQAKELMVLDGVRSQE